MHQQRNVAGIHIGKRQPPFHGIDQCPGRIAAPTGDLGNRHVAGFFIEYRDVGERATDVDTQSYAHRCVLLVFASRRDDQVDDLGG